MSTGPKEEFERFFKDNCGQLVGIAYLWCGDRQEALDLAQETLTRTWEHWEAVSAHPNPEAWARRVLHNLCHSRWRRRKLERSMAFPERIVNPGLPDVAELDVARFVAQLAPNPRRALVLHDVVGLSVAEVADEMVAREGTVRSWLSRSRETIRRQMSAGEHESGYPADD